MIQIDSVGGAIIERNATTENHITGRGVENIASKGTRIMLCTAHINVHHQKDALEEAIFAGVFSGATRKRESPNRGHSVW